MKYLLHITLMIVIASIAWMTGAATRDVIITVSGSCAAMEAFEPPADPGLTAPGWDSPTLDLPSNQGEA